MTNVFLLYMPPGNAEAMVHYQDTIAVDLPANLSGQHITSPGFRPRPGAPLPD